MAARTNTGDSTALVIESFPRLTDDQLRLARNCIAQPALSDPRIPTRLRREPQPDVELLFTMLDLTPREPAPEPVVKEKRKKVSEWCDVHNMKREYRKSRGSRCPACHRENQHDYYMRKKNGNG